MNFDFYIFEKENLIGIFDDYTSIIWNSALNDYAEISIKAPLNDKNLNLLKENHFIVNLNPCKICSFSKPSSDSSETRTLRNMYQGAIIVSVEKNYTEYTITAKALTLEYLLTYRICSFYNPEDRWTAETYVAAINYLFNAAFRISPVGRENVYIDDFVDLTPNMSVSQGQNLKEQVLVAFKSTYEIYNEVFEQDQGTENITSYGVFFNVGWELYSGTEGSIEVNARQSFDRSANDDDEFNSPVIFSTMFENLYKFIESSDSQEFSNVAFVAGEGEGADRILVWAPSENIGLENFERRELFVDGSSLKSGDYASTTKYKEALKALGISKLIAPVKNYSFEVPADSKFLFREHFYLGDYVKISLIEYGIELSAQVAGAIETYDKDGYTCEITFGNLKQTLSQRLNKKFG